GRRDRARPSALGGLALAHGGGGPDLPVLSDTEDFVQLAEKISGKSLDGLFQKWIHDTGKPAL
ncbi:hypothetical protein ABZ726_37050, partial [Streptomyces hundungensis]|uniref:hypothetical protein n=1 Tax=Streptomyces hundungensis TaxID=1077946 RepID=UPI0033FCBF03